MQTRKVIIATLACLTAQNAAAQLYIDNLVTARGYDPSTDSHTDTFGSTQEWEAHNRDTNLTAVSHPHPFDPPINVSTAMSHFNQPQYALATVRASSFVLSDYSGISSSMGYEAFTSFIVKENLVVTTGAFEGPMVHIQCSVPMHGYLAARGGPNGDGFAYASLNVSGSDVNPLTGSTTLIDQLQGEVQVEGTDYNVFTLTTSGMWNGDTQNSLVNLPTGNQPRSSDGIELQSDDLLDLGYMQANDTREFAIDYEMYTSASIPNPNSLFALSDFSGTGNLNFVAHDADGNPFTNFTVNPADAVPEPVTLAALTLALVAARRRRVK